MLSRIVTGFALGFLCMALISCAERSQIKKPAFKKDAVEELAESAESSTYHIVEKDETLYRISLKHGVSVAAIRQANGLKNTASIKVGQRLVIPGKVSSEKEDAKSRKEPDEPEEPQPARVAGRFIWPVQPVSIGSGFGVRSDSKHDGVDLRGPKGAPILASAGGKVIFSGAGPAGYGNMVIIKHDAKTITIYAHNDENIATEGQEIKQGEKVATVGRSGRANGYHCHFEIRINRKPVDPVKHLPELK